MSRGARGGHKLSKAGSARGFNREFPEHRRHLGPV